MAFVTVHRRIKRIKTARGFKVVQDTNAYSIQEPQGLGLPFPAKERGRLSRTQQGGA